MPPWNDGSKNLVRDVASHLARVSPIVLTDGSETSLPSSVRRDDVYVTSGAFTPALEANARVFGRLVLGERAAAWHFVFAPNPASSYAARAARTMGRMRGPVFQTIASAPKSFEGVSKLLFGDVLIALSEHTKSRLLAAGAKKRIVVVPPCAALPAAARGIARGSARTVARQALGLSETDVVALYPGDYEVSTGARTVASAAAALVREGVRVVFACRAKTMRAGAARKEVEGLHADASANSAKGMAPLHVGEVKDMWQWIAAADVVLFPVDELYGKVDLPLVLLEALALGKPVVVADGGPLPELGACTVVPPRDSEALARAALALLRTPPKAEDLVAHYENHFSPAVVAGKYDALYEESGL
ncbi:MAG: glycosyltransferase [Polyangiaceae bacterium]